MKEDIRYEVILVDRYGNRSRLIGFFDSKAEAAKVARKHVGTAGTAHAEIVRTATAIVARIK